MEFSHRESFYTFHAVAPNISSFIRLTRPTEGEGRSEDVRATEVRSSQ